MNTKVLIPALAVWAVIGLGLLPMQAPAQLDVNDSLALIDVLHYNCQGCPLRNSGMPQFYWDTAQVAANWPGIVIQNQRVTEIHLNNCGLSGNFADINACTELKILNLDENDLRGMPPLQIPELQKWSFKNNSVKFFPVSLSLDNLRTLDCSFNLLENLPHISDLPNLDSLDCRYNQIPTVYLENFLGAYYFLSPNVPESASNWQAYFSDLSLQWQPQPNDQYLVAPEVTFVIPTGDTCRVPELGQLAKLLSGDLVTLEDSNGQVLTAPDCLSQAYAVEVPVSADSIRYSLTGPNQFNVNNTIFDYRCSPFQVNLPFIDTVQIVLDIRLSDHQVLCGDVDGNGIRDMYDLFPIAYFWGLEGLPRSGISPSDEASPRPAVLWDSTLTLGSQTINAANADANGDGVINELDAACIQAQYSRLNENNYLNSSLQDTITLRAVPVDSDILTYPNGDVKIPFQIQIVELPNNMDGVFIRGVIFIRGVAESEAYSVDSIYGDFSRSNFLETLEPTLGLQIYHDTTVLDVGNLSCLGFESKQLDVAVFRCNHSAWMKKNETLLDCHVLIHPEDNALSNLPAPIFPVIADVNSVVLYLEDSNGEIYQVRAVCKSDTTLILLDSLPGQTVISGHTYHPNGLPIPGVELTGSITVDIISTQCNDSGDYSLVTPCQESLTVYPSKTKDSLAIAHINRSDLNLLTSYVFDNKPQLSPEQMWASDLNGDGLVDFADYLELRDYVNEDSSGFSIGLDWVFRNDDAFFTALPYIVYTDHRSYPSASRTYGEDYVGVLLGDVDMSWGGRPQRNDLLLASSIFVSPPYPNPSANGFQFEVFSPRQDQLELLVVDLSGEVILRQTTDVYPGSDRIELDLPTDLGKGIYSVQVRGKDLVEVFKIVHL